MQKRNRSMGPFPHFRPPFNFISLHYAYFVITILFSSLVFWATSTTTRLRYVDCLFLVTSAMTETGLNTINLSTLNTFQQALLFVLIILGSPIFVSWVVVMFRKRAFEQRFKELVGVDRRGENITAVTDNFRSERASDVRLRERTTDEENTHVPVSEDGDRPCYHLQCSEELLATSPGDKRDNRRGASIELYQVHGNSVRREASGSSELPTIWGPSVPKISTEASNVIRSSRCKNFQGSSEAEDAKTSLLTRQRRVELGGVEYRAVRLFSWLIPAYYFAWQVFTCLTIVLYIHYQKSEIAKNNGISVLWLGIFVPVSAFNNCGLSLLDESMVPLGTNTFLLLLLILVMLAGNTAYPIFLRVLVWILECLTPRKKQLHQTLLFILEHPRRVYTYMFPAPHTLWLCLSLCGLTAIDWIALELLDLHNPAVTTLPVAARVSDGLFQSIANRSTGFDVIPISTLAVGFQVLCVTMMYISIYPIAITLRTSNVYEERSLGILSPPRDPAIKQNTGRLNFIQQQTRLQLSHDLWWITISTIIIVIIETASINADPTTFSIFNFIFEVVSAYGPVGLSEGLPNEAYSFCGAWRAGSKVVLCAVMLRGRHRGLPVAIDGAVMLPGDERSDDVMGDEAAGEGGERCDRTGSRKAIGGETGLECGCSRHLRRGTVVVVG